VALNQQMITGKTLVPWAVFFQLALYTDLLSVICCTKYPNAAQKIHNVGNFFQGKNLNL
jgi:hypothetical protein